MQWINYHIQLVQQSMLNSNNFNKTIDNLKSGTYLWEKNKLYIKLPDDCFDVWSMKLTVVARALLFFTTIFLSTDEMYLKKKKNIVYY